MSAAIAEFLNQKFTFPHTNKGTLRLLPLLALYTSITLAALDLTQQVLAQDVAEPTVTSQSTEPQAGDDLAVPKTAKSVASIQELENRQGWESSASPVFNQESARLLLPSSDFEGTQHQPGQETAKAVVVPTTEIRQAESISEPIAGAKTAVKLPADSPVASKLEETQFTGRLAQASNFLDVQGNWAQTFIEALAARDIIQGFPDGSFRPNAPVTRAEFAALISKAFPKEPIRQGIRFVDVPVNNWAYPVIQEAYRAGFLQGYPKRVFKPTQRLTRVQALVALASGLNLSPTNAANLNSYFQDAEQIPNYARNSIAAATENRLVVNYPNVNFLNPNQIATRADVAAFIYQGLVKNGTLQQQSSSALPTEYIVGYQPPMVAQTPSEPPPPPLVPVETLREQFQISEPPTIEVPVASAAVGVPAVSLTTPSAFGADFGDFFLGAGYQSTTRYTDTNDAGVAVGFGLGNARNLAGLEVGLASFSTSRSGLLNTGAISFKLHKLLSNDLAIAIGAENSIRYGTTTDAIPSGYGVVSKIFRLQDDASKPLSAVTVSLGVGGGRFRSESDILDGKNSVNVFGALGVRVARPLSLLADWNGQDLTLGASIAPFRNIPLVISPAYT
ncbi:MAG TPA: S-layer homology domain-containing protein, partial [Candidatus Obscuribacterales bacterium]